jgi:TonB family protein
MVRVWFAVASGVVRGALACALVLSPATAIVLAPATALVLAPATAVVLAPATAVAQSLSVEDQAEPPPKAAPQPSGAPVPPPPPPVIVMPVAHSTPLSYPEGATGEASVVLELSLSGEGNVTSAKALEGDEPFASVAVAAAQGWSFEPATRDGQPIPARIRFLVQFKPPVIEAPPEPEQAAAPGAPADGATPAAPPAKPYEIVVLGDRPPIRHELGQVEVARMPGAFGDAYRAIEALPGVVPIVSGLPYFYVRGAPPGNVGYFFDGIPVPFLYHFAAGPGIFQPAFVDRVDLYPGAYPVRYGRFAGAIVAGEMAPPGYRTRGEWRIRLVDSGAMVEAPLGERGSIMLGGRFSYTGLVLSLIQPEVSVGYWDYQLRARYDLSAKDSVEVFAFGSGDYVTNTDQHFTSDANGNSVEVARKTTIVDVNFHRVDLRWDHRLDQGNWRNALMIGRDRTGLDNGNVDVFDYLAGLRSEYQQQLEPQLRLRAGADVLFESLQQEFKDQQEREAVPAPPDGSDSGLSEPPDSGPRDEGDNEDFGFTPQRKDFTAGLYADVVWDAAPAVRIIPGVRLDLFVSGSQLAVGFDPRITAEYQLSKKLKLVHGLALVHQAPSFVAAVPGFKPSLAGGLQKAVQHSASMSYELPAGFSSSLALFQSAFVDMTDPISLLQLQQTADVDVDDPSDFRTDGHAYGFELMVRRSLARRLGGFVSYTLSRSLRYAGKLSGPATTDRTHVLNVAASYDLGRDWRIGGRVLFYTGIPAEVAYLEAARHPPRTPPFWRLDWKLEKRWYIRRPDRWWGLSIEVLNTTLNKEKLSGSCNAYACTYEEIGPVTVPALSFEGAL